MDHSTPSIKKRSQHFPANQQLYINEANAVVFFYYFNFF